MDRVEEKGGLLNPNIVTVCGSYTPDTDKEIIIGNILPDRILAKTRTILLEKGRDNGWKNCK